MKVAQVGPTKLNGEKCRICKKPVRDGQYVLDVIVMDLPPASQHFVQHVRCVTRLVSDAPADADVASFDALRDEIIRTGDPFATVSN